MGLSIISEVKKLDEITFARNNSMLGCSKEDVLIMCTDAGFSASMMVFYIGKESEGGLELNSSSALESE